MTYHGGKSAKLTTTSSRTTTTAAAAPPAMAAEQTTTINFANLFTRRKKNMTNEPMYAIIHTFTALNWLKI